MRTIKHRAIGVAIIAVAAAAAAFVYAQKTAAPSAEPERFLRFTATSDDGLQAALDEAVKQALAHEGKSVVDGMVEYEVEKIAGRNGGIAGFHQTTVTIRCRARGG